MKSKCIRNVATGEVRRVKEDVAVAMVADPRWTYTTKSVFRRSRQ